MRKLPLPTKEQREWADCEIGVIIHLDVQVFEPDYNFRRSWGYTPPASVFNPALLDTDQWIATARDAGAKYAILVAKHCSGFSLWPTHAHDYSIKSSPWKNGKGDIVADFFQSCKKFGLRPGLYCSASCNAFLNVDNPGQVRDGSAEDNARYNKIVEMQLTELWTNYGKVFEIWFDGGVIEEEQGGPAIVPILRAKQPEAIVLGGPAGWPALLRTIGNERGEAPEPCWATANELHGEDDGTILCPRPGDPEGQIWVPGESDLPNRDQNRAFQGGWFWRAGEEQFLYSLDHLVERYFTSVGRNTNMLIGMVIDNRGLVPEPDQARFREFGERIQKVLKKPIAQTSGTEEILSVHLPHNHSVAMICLMEDIEAGERVRQFVVEGLLDGRWITVWAGSNIGHKHLERVQPRPYQQLRLRILQSEGTPQIRDFSAWEIEPGLIAGPLDVAARASLSIKRDKFGLVSIVCDNPHLAIRYTVNGSAPDASAMRYAAPFPLPDGGMVQAAAFLNELSQSPTCSAAFGLDRSAWKVVRVSLESPYVNGGTASSAHLLDDNPDTYWHTYHSDKKLSAPPHEAVLEMDQERTLCALTILPHTDGGHAVATPDRYEFSLSLDGTTWSPAAAGELPDLQNNPGMQVIALTHPQRARFIRLVATRATGDADYIVVAGIGAIESKV